MIPDRHVVVLVMEEHLLVALLTVPGAVAVPDFAGVTHPVHRRRESHEGAPAPVPHRTDQLVDRIVVGRTRVLVHVETGEAADTLLVHGIVRIHQTHVVEHLDAFGVVHPVRMGRKLLEVHPIGGEGHELGPCLAELPHVAVVDPLGQLHDPGGAAQRVHLRPSVDVLDGVVRAVVHAPAQIGEQIAALVEVALGKALHGDRTRAQQLALQQRPLGGHHRSLHTERDSLGVQRLERREGAPRDERADPREEPPRDQVLSHRVPPTRWDRSSNP